MKTLFRFMIITMLITAFAFTACGGESSSKGEGDDAKWGSAKWGQGKWGE